MTFSADRERYATKESMLRYALESRQRVMDEHAAKPVSQALRESREERARLAFNHFPEAQPTPVSHPPQPEAQVSANVVTRQQQRHGKAPISHPPTPETQIPGGVFANVETRQQQRHGKAPISHPPTPEAQPTDASIETQMTRAMTGEAPAGYWDAPPPAPATSQYRPPQEQLPDVNPVQAAVDRIEAVPTLSLIHI